MTREPSQDQPSTSVATSGLALSAVAKTATKHPRRVLRIECDGEHWIVTPETGAAILQSAFDAVPPVCHGNVVVDVSEEPVMPRISNERLGELPDIYQAFLQASDADMKWDEALDVVLDLRDARAENARLRAILQANASALGAPTADDGDRGTSKDVAKDLAPERKLR